MKYIYTLIDRFISKFIILLFIFSSISYSQINLNEAPAFNKSNLEPFLDSLITNLMKEQNIIGSGITIVKDTGIVLSKGYGFADLENKKSFDPENTLFRTASVCKVVVATTLMMLKEKGLIDFKTDEKRTQDSIIHRMFQRWQG